MRNAYARGNQDPSQTIAVEVVEVDVPVDVHVDVQDLIEVVIEVDPPRPSGFEGCIRSAVDIGPGDRAEGSRHREGPSGDAGSGPRGIRRSLP